MVNTVHSEEHSLTAVLCHSAHFMLESTVEMVPETANSLRSSMTVDLPVRACRRHTRDLQELTFSVFVKRPAMYVCCKIR